MHSILGSYARFHAACFHLSQEQIRTIMNNEGSSHPLYLHILLNSLRTIASLACLPDIAVNHVLSKVQNIHHVEGLLSLVLELCEKDVEMNVDGTDKGLLPRVLSLLYVSHKGLSEDELFEALNDIQLMESWEDEYLTFLLFNFSKFSIIHFFNFNTDMNKAFNQF